MQPTYEPHPKHKKGFTVAGPPKHVPGGSKCPREIDLDESNRLLRFGVKNGFTEGVTKGGFPKRVYGFKDGRFFRANSSRHQKPIYHGHPVEPVEVPTKIKRLMRDIGLFDESAYRKYRGSVR